MATIAVYDHDLRISRPATPGVSAADMAVPKMSVHWVDVRSPELQELLGNHAAHRPAVIGGAGGDLSNDLRGVPMNHPPWCDAAAVAKAKDHGLTAVAFPMARVG
ncbi:MAG TPA: hypothetical protein VMM18_06465 [Gemmatimonadaceae bacterium]|nr:hypothetical protein [Gemmatimonadaceae bacterium]